MENSVKYIIIVIISTILFIPMFFGVYIEHLLVRELNFYSILFLLSGLLILLSIGKLIEIFIFNRKNIELMKKHDVTNALINNDNRIIIWLFFPLTMIMEELIFRYYLISFLIYSIKLEVTSVIFISSFFFSMYHFHTWFSYKSVPILLVNLSFPFLLGLFNGYIFLTLGIIPCIIVHFTVAFLLYYNIYVKYTKNNKN